MHTSMRDRSGSHDSRNKRTSPTARYVGFVFSAVTLMTGSSLASGARAEPSAAQLSGTWECHGPGQTGPMKPPIVWFGETKSVDGKMSTIEVDGFSRDVQGTADVSMEAGVIKVAAKSGHALLVSGYNDRGGRKVSMHLRREGVGDYRCYRLPKYDTPMIPRQKNL